MRGYFGIGVFHSKTAENIGTLWRSAYNLGADFIFTIGKRYSKQCSDVSKAWRKIPLYHYENYEDFRRHIPYDCRLVAIELDNKAKDLKLFTHPERCIYLLGAEDHGLPQTIIDQCQETVMINSNLCMNVAVAGSIVMYDRQINAG